ncbi:uncharacterized protein KRP23_5607 [Phytophthora ramorum]|uniref:uncharacterized protein n=1 Tax=Phytophthora ramorum TaxID=164328 RepID=UPI00309C540B|nr:hypothetical protein KRP23_5607 [Phytophthora ramorum]KAH7505693.1 hypothetical protein KRP22_3666 [Phytophthora ramorum]
MSSRSPKMLELQPIASGFYISRLNRSDPGAAFPPLKTMPQGRRSSTHSNNEPSVLSEYELKRRNKMTENTKFLQSLGAQLDMKLQKKKKQKSSKPKKATAAPAAKAVRRSPRLRDAPIRTAAAERERRREEMRKQKIKDFAAKKRRYWTARKKRIVADAAAAAAAAERSLRVENRATNNKAV